MKFREFLESFDSNAEGWADMILYRSRTQFDSTRLLVFADWLEEHGYGHYAQLIRCTMNGHFPTEDGQTSPQECDPFELTSLARQINQFSFLQTRRVEGGALQLSDGTNVIRVLGRGGRVYFYDEYGVRLPNLNDAHRRLLAFGVLKRFVYYFLQAAQTTATQRKFATGGRRRYFR